MKAKILYMLAVFALGSCSEFLDEVPRHNLTMENAVKDYNGAQNVLNGMYSDLTYIYAPDLGGTLSLTLAAQGGFYRNYPENYNMSYREGDKDQESTWSSFYTVVNSANAAYTGIDRLNESLFPTPGTKKAMLAEARCMRAWAFANLFWLYGYWWAEDDSPYGIIWRDEMANLKNLQCPRLTVGDSYRKIFEDLDDAIRNMPDFTTSRYLSKQMAQVLKAKMLLYRGAMRGSQADLREALDLVDEVKTTAPAEFEMEEDITQMYEQGWDSKEVLWARYLGDSRNISTAEPAYAQIIGNRNTYYEIANDWLKSDERYVYVMDSVRGPSSWSDEKVWAPVKLYHQGPVTSPNAPYTVYYFRKAELYLMEAELKARLESEYTVADALKPLNEMRSKRVVPRLPRLEITTRPELLRAIFKEIWAEQFLENGSEYFASLRFVNDTDASAAQNKPWIYTLKPDVNFTEKQYCWPIPEKEMESNYAAEQNPGLGK